VDQEPRVLDALVQDEVARLLGDPAAARMPCSQRYLAL
jgi:hypothetical protein